MLQSETIERSDPTDMTRQHPLRPYRRGIASLLRGLVAAGALVLVTAGLPWLLVTLAGSPIPGQLPHWDEITSTLSRRDDGTLLLGFLTHLAWVLWLVWAALVLLESVAQLRGRSAPHEPGAPRRGSSATRRAPRGAALRTAARRSPPSPRPCGRSRPPSGSARLRPRSGVALHRAAA